MAVDSISAHREAARTRFHELMLTGGDDRQLAGFSVFRLFDEYLAWVQAQRSARTYEWYRDFLKQFSKFLKVDRPAEKLKPYDVLRWITGHPNWLSTYQNNAIRSVQRPYRWAQRLGFSTGIRWNTWRSRRHAVAELARYINSSP